MAIILPEDGYDSYITAALSDSDTTIYVNELPQKSAGVLTIYDIDGRTVKEKIYYTGTASSPNRLTTVTRGLATVDSAGVISFAAVPANQLSHPSNVRIAMTDNIHYLARVISVLNGNEEMGGVMQLPAARTIDSARDVIDKEYADAIGGAAGGITAFLVTQNGADPSLTINVGAGYFVNGATSTSYAGASAQAVTANQTNYVQLTKAGALVINTSGFVDGNLSLAEVVTNGTDITSITDRRAWLTMPLTTDQVAAIAGSSGTPSTSNKFVTEADTRLFATGIITPYGGFTAPSGWLLCDGAAVSRATYATLWALLNPSLGTATMTIASPAVVSKTAHGLVLDDKIYFTTTGALPTGVSANTIYYVISAGLTADAFQFSATKGGSAINSSGSQSGVHTLLRSPYGLGDGSTTFNTPSLKGVVPVGRDSAQTEFNAVGETGGAKTHTLDTTEIPAHTHTISANNGGTGGSTPSPGSTSSSTNATYQSGSTGGGGAHNNLQPYIALNYIIKT